MTALSFTVLGVPQPAGSKRAFPNRKTGGVIVTDDAKNSRPWKQQVAGAGEHAIALHDWPRAYHGPLRLEITFTVQRPKGHFGSGRNAATVRPAAPAWPQVRPDASKLVRAAEDALTGIVWHDDAQVVLQSVAKRYGETPSAQITVTMLPTTVADAEAAAL